MKGPNWYLVMVAVVFVLWAVIIIIFVQPHECIQRVVYICNNCSLTVASGAANGSGGTGAAAFVLGR